MTDYKEYYLKLVSDLSKEIDIPAKLKNKALDVYIRDAMSQPCDNDKPYEYMSKPRPK